MDGLIQIDTTKRNSEKENDVNHIQLLQQKIGDTEKHWYTYGTNQSDKKLRPYQDAKSHPYKMYGGTGDDVFWNQESGTGSVVTIKDFTDGGDKISLNTTAFTTLSYSLYNYKVEYENGNPKITRQSCFINNFTGQKTCSDYYKDVVVEGGRKGEILTPGSLNNTNVIIKR